MFKNNKKHDWFVAINKTKFIFTRSFYVFHDNNNGYTFGPRILPSLSLLEIFLVRIESSTKLFKSLRFIILFPLVKIYFSKLALSKKSIEKKKGKKFYFFNLFKWNCWTKLNSRGRVSTARKKYRRLKVQSRVFLK